MKNCPVCQHEHEDESKLHCPKCDSDLTPFMHLDQITNNTSRLNKTNKILIALVFLVIAGWGFNVFYPTATEVPAITVEEAPQPENKGIIENNDQISTINLEIKQKDKKISKLENQLADLKSKHEEHPQPEIDIEETGNQQAGKYTLHIIEDGESLWTISERYYGSGFAVNKLLEQNKLDNPQFIKPGDPIIIKN